MSANDGGPAFPFFSEQTGPHGGMSLRAYFMAHAPFTLDDAISASAPSYDDTHRAVYISILALLRAEYADAMLAELEKGAKG